MSILGYQIIKHCVFTLIFLSSSSFYLFEEEVGECTFSIGSNKWGHVRADHDQNSIFVFSPSFQFSGVCSCHKVAACLTGGEWWPCLCKSCSTKRGKVELCHLRLSNSWCFLFMWLLRCGGFPKTFSLWLFLVLQYLLGNWIKLVSSCGF